MANPPFNVNGVREADVVSNMERLPFGLPAVNKDKEISNANYLWIQYFYAYLKETGRAGFVMASSATDSQSKDKGIREQLVRTGHVDCLISVANNFFYTLSLPCTLWFFDKNKRQENLDKILFIDARNYFTVVDKTLNEWNEWQMHNLKAIVWLYRGEKDKYLNLIACYKGNTNESFAQFDLHGDLTNPKECLSIIETKLSQERDILKSLEAERKATRKKKEKEELKEKISAQKERVDCLEDHAEMARQYVWLTDRFGDEGVYRDIPGLCKIATIEEVEAKSFSLTPGVYTGAEEVEDDGVDFESRMKEIHAELEKLQNESNEIFARIKSNEALLWK